MATPSSTPAQATPIHSSSRNKVKSHKTAEQELYRLIREIERLKEIISTLEAKREHDKVQMTGMSARLQSLQMKVNQLTFAIHALQRIVEQMTMLGQQR
ncbi:hypothetical protein N7462_009114 [Penicillium macrosclerotiorum]|uniref:uncharacterized protein n=1 Tax=Penicillium macrosclerotiorum TaxID=303699 RepID=UPI002546B457|nr:uncharacterized protein N7462_009114 [Penicillium macrosclerotiorum]KAJ5676217.1 hypothetical protein N7462_009114 [Penicillium macrosclerotiorum]